MTTYFLKQLDGKNQQGTNTPVYYSYQDAEAMAWYIYRKHGQLYAIETTQKENN